MNIKIIYRLFILLVILTPSYQPVWAFHPLATDDTGTQGPGGIEIELSHQVSRTSLTNLDYQFDTGISIHFGLSKTLDLGLTTFFQSTFSPSLDWKSGLAPTVVDLKWMLWGHPELKSSLALRLDYSPKPLSTISSGGHDLGVLLINCWNLGEFSFHLNLGGYAKDLAIKGALGTLHTGVAVTAPLTKVLQAAAETVYETGPFDGVHKISGTGGLLWEIRPGKVLSLGAGPTWEAGGRVGWITSVGFTISLPHDSPQLLASLESQNHAPPKEYRFTSTINSRRKAQ